MEKWKKDTAQARSLTKEQNQNLKSFLSKIGSERALTRKEIVTFIEEIRKPRKYRQSGHLVDEKLKYSCHEETQLTIFDRLSPSIVQKIEKSKIEVKAEGIKLTPPENKLIHALNVILHDKSQNTNIKSGKMIIVVICQADSI